MPPQKCRAGNLPRFWAQQKTPGVIGAVFINIPPPPEILPEILLGILPDILPDRVYRRGIYK